MASLNFFTVDNPSVVKGTLAIQDGQLVETGCARWFIPRYARQGKSPAEIFAILGDNWTNGHYFSEPA